MGEKVCFSLDKWREDKAADGDGVHSAAGDGSTIEEWIRRGEGFRYATWRVINDQSLDEYLRYKCIIIKISYVHW